MAAIRPTIEADEVEVTTVAPVLGIVVMGLITVGLAPPIVGLAMVDVTMSDM